MDFLNRVLQGDALETLKGLPDECVQMCVTSPPYYGLRDYGVEGQIGLEETPEAFIARLVEVFAEVRRVLKADGTLWVNIGDSYAGSGRGGNPDGGGKQGTNAGSKSVNSYNKDFHDKLVEQGAIGRSWVKPPAGYKQKDLIGVPWMLAFALRADGWYLRSDIIWSKPNPMPESVTDRPTKAHEYLFLLSKSQTYYYDHEAIKERLRPASIERISQNVEEQAGSDRVPGKTNGPMKAVVFGGNKADGYGDRRKSGKEWNPMQAGSGMTPEKRDTVGSETLTANKKSVWSVATHPFKEAHFATFPEKLIQPCIMAGSKEGDTVLDPFFGAGTTGVVCKRLARNYIGCELNPEYIQIAERRIGGISDSLFSQAA
jgi:DNA modification methylase